MPRITELKPEEMNDAQARIAGEIAAGPRGGLRGPFPAWLRSPELADRGQKLGEFIRFNTSFPPTLSELAILITARHWTAQYEWYAHARIAREAGIDAAVIEAIAKRERPPLDTEEAEIIYDFCTENYATHRVGDGLYARAVDAFGEKGVAELVGIMGYYTLVAMTLNVFELSVPEGEPEPLAP
ncbi:MAG: carboxymuconolactone decarboxylase family protein [Alphaproteobacteria bacterium]|jgi:4-carboxymuconolactone decarboxylase|nr:carboxymuconolactone decarboxylase family protein [Alphaproteobacteria bacterium]